MQSGRLCKGFWRRPEEPPHTSLGLVAVAAQAPSEADHMGLAPSSAAIFSGGDSIKGAATPVPLDAVFVTTRQMTAAWRGREPSNKMF